MSTQNASRLVVLNVLLLLASLMFALTSSNPVTIIAGAVTAAASVTAITLYCATRRQS